MIYPQVVGTLSQDMVDKLTTAIEIGRWESGEKLSEKQLESAMQAVMYWQAKNNHNNDSEPFVIGAQGQLYTGKGESHKLSRVEKDLDPAIIIKQKV